MRGGWGRWWGYMDELEEVMRACGDHLAGLEALLAERYERSSWRGVKRDSVSAEIVRRAVDMPFLGELIREAREIESIEALPEPGFEGRDWRPEEEGASQPSVSRAPRTLDRASDEARGGDRSDEPPPRLVAAERTLAERSRSIVVVLDNLINSRNVSAVVRTVEALGLQELHIVQAKGKPALDRHLTTYSHRWLDLFWYRDIAQALDGLAERGYRILAADFACDAQPVEQTPIDGPVALVFGSEQRGVSEAARERANALFYLPTPGFTSYLNVSVAVGVSLYAVDRRMREVGLRAPLSEEEKAALRPAWYHMLARGHPGREREFRSWVDRPPDPQRN